jgi:asparagine synthase (glutamine-hydrolysing)
MNGIFAFHYAASLPRETELLATRDVMRTRGPDGEGAWWSNDRRCALGHRRLSILDLSDRAAQPMVSENGKLVVTFNGEIYNYPALRRELEAEGLRFRTTSDTEVLLHLYAGKGAEMLHRLRGMFAFAIWTTKNARCFSPAIPMASSRFTPLMTAGRSSPRENICELTLRVPIEE